MEANCKVRLADMNDLEAVFSFISHLEERSFDFELFRAKYSQNLDDKNIIYLVSVNENDDVNGFISCHGQDVLHHETRVFEIQELYVARNFRDKGIGKELMSAIEEKIEKLGCESFEVSTHVKRTDARKFYSRLGFQSTHVKLVKEL